MRRPGKGTKRRVAIGWFFAPYKRRPADSPTRYCAMNDFNTQIEADGGAWREAECLGNYAVCKVRASVGTLAAIRDTAGFQRINVTLLSDPLSSLTVNQRQGIRDFLVGTLGFPLAELQERFPNDLGTYTLGDVLRFALRRRLKPRYAAGADAIVLDGAVQPTLAVEQVDAGVD
jgi:hypothetical protein